MPGIHDTLRRAAQQTIIAWADAQTPSDMTEAIQALRDALDLGFPPSFPPTMTGFRAPELLGSQDPIRMTETITEVIVRGRPMRWKLVLRRTLHEDTAPLADLLKAQFAAASEDALCLAMPTLQGGGRAQQTQMVWFSQVTPIRWITMRLEKW